MTQQVGWTPVRLIAQVEFFDVLDAGGVQFWFCMYDS